MKTFQNTAAQGDVYFQRVDALPEGVVEVPAEEGQVIVAHSETGHHHVMDAETTKMYRLPEEIYEAFLVVDQPTELQHLRDHHTHETLEVPPGVFRITNQREQDLQAQRVQRVAD